MIRLIFAALVAVALLCLAPVARAHTITWPDGESFTFDTYCCNATDCEAVPMSAITEVKGGYQVDYWTKIGGFSRHIKGLVPHGSKQIRFNPFADRIMACASGMPVIGTSEYLPRCIYPIQPSM